MELSEEDKKRGKQAGIYVLQGNRAIPTNYGKAAALTHTMNARMELLYLQGVEPTKEEIMSLARQSWQIRKLLLMAEGEVYVKPELWLVSETRAD